MYISQNISLVSQGRKINVKAGSFTWLAGCFNIALVILNDLFTNCKANA